MIYRQVLAKESLRGVVKSFWLVDSENDNSIQRDKIIPDGYLEMIFHYRDPYKSNINGYWRDQRDKYIIAGQIRNYFYLENTGLTGMFGIKFQPWVFKELFNIEMKLITDDAIAIPPDLFEVIKPLANIAVSLCPFEEKVTQCEHWLQTVLGDFQLKKIKEKKAVQLILESNGQYGLESLLDKVNISERQLERYFKAYIGVTPKFYCRIIRFAQIFKLITTESPNWSEISVRAGFYDQSHFIKNFKEFTGEEPSKYGFTDNNMANDYLR